MEIVFPNDRLAREFSDTKTLVRHYGAENAQRIRRRLDDLRAADNLATMRLLFGGRLHPLTGDLAGRFALDVRHPQRLIFEPADEPLPRLDDGSLDWTRVLRVRILRVEDYHA